MEWIHNFWTSLLKRSSIISFNSLFHKDLSLKTRFGFFFTKETKPPIYFPFPWIAFMHCCKRIKKLKSGWRWEDFGVCHGMLDGHASRTDDACPFLFSPVEYTSRKTMSLFLNLVIQFRDDNIDVPIVRSTADRTGERYLPKFFLRKIWIILYLKEELKISSSNLMNLYICGI